MPYPDDFNDAAFASAWADAPAELADDFHFIEHQADAILDEMVAAVRSVVAAHGLSFFRESGDVLRETLFDEFIVARLKVSEEAIEAAGYEVPMTKYIAQVRAEREEVARMQGAGRIGAEGEVSLEVRE